jgi:hypothetical protein
MVRTRPPRQPCLPFTRPSGPLTFQTMPVLSASPRVGRPLRLCAQSLLLEVLLLITLIVSVAGAVLYLGLYLVGEGRGGPETWNFGITEN